MGTMTYGADLSVTIPDRALRHVQIVIGIKLRRGEPFYFTWRIHSGGEGRESIWIHPALPLHFRIDTAGAPGDINPDWIAQLLDAASSTSGLSLAYEPDARDTVITSSGPSGARMSEISTHTR